MQENKFNEQIRQQNGKLDINQLRRLTTWKKKNYIKMVIESDNQVHDILYNTK